MFAKIRQNLKPNILLPFSLGFLITSVFRSINAVMGPVLSKDLHLTTAALGIITSSYVLAFAFAQIPLGILLDRFGPRLVQGCFFIIGGIAIILFGSSHGTFGLTASRALLGLGMSGGLMAAIKAITLWYPKDDIPKMNGIIMAFGGIGAVTATLPTEIFLRYFSWRLLCSGLGVITILTAVLIFMTIPKYASEDKPSPLKEQIAELINIYKTPNFYSLAPAIVTVLGGFIAIQGLWAGTWLQQIIGLNPKASANILLMVALATILTSFASGMISRTAKKLNHPLHHIVLYFAILNIIISILIFSRLLPNNSYTWFGLGVCGAGISLGYAVIAQHFPVHLSGRAITAVSIAIFIFAFISQYFIGLIVHLVGELTKNNIIGYQAAFGLVILSQILAVVWYLKHKNTLSTDKP